MHSDMAAGLSQRLQERVNWWLHPGLSIAYVMRRSPPWNSAPRMTAARGRLFCYDREIATSASHGRADVWNGDLFARGRTTALVS
jgi:hypothetical protein